MKAWTRIEYHLLTNFYEADLPIRMIAEALDRTKSQVANKICQVYQRGRYGLNEPVVHDDLPKCDRKWAQLLAGARYESLNIRPTYTYQPDINGIEIA